MNILFSLIIAILTFLVARIIFNETISFLFAALAFLSGMGFLYRGGSPWSRW